VKPKLLRTVKHHNIENEFYGEIYGVFESDANYDFKLAEIFPDINFSNTVLLPYVIKNANGKILEEVTTHDIEKINWEELIAMNKVCVTRSLLCITGSMLKKKYSLIRIEADLKEKIDRLEEEILRKIVRYNENNNKKKYDQSVTDGLPDSLKLL